MPKPLVHVVVQRVQQVGASEEGDAHQIGPATQANALKLCPAGKDRVVRARH